MPMRRRKFQGESILDTPRQQAMTPAEALKKLAALCARGEHSTGDADEKMRRWGLSDDDRLQVIRKLVDNKFIDDQRFTKYFVHDKIKFNHWGRRKIEVSLRQKGVDSQIIAEALDEVPDSEYLEILRPMIKSKIETTKAATDYERAMKTIKWAAGRGFSLELIRQCIDSANEYNDAEADEYPED